MSIAVLPSSSPSPARDSSVHSHGAVTAERAAALLAGCSTARHGSELHGAAVRAGVDRDRAVAFHLQRAYAASSRLDLVVSLLRRTPAATAVFYTSAIHAHSSRGLYLAALAILSDMLSDGILPTAHTLSASLPTCRGGLVLGCALHAYAFKLALSCDSYVATALLGMYAWAGDAVAARALFDEISTCVAPPACSDRWEQREGEGARRVVPVGREWREARDGNLPAGSG